MFKLIKKYSFLEKRYEFGGIIRSTIIILLGVILPSIINLVWGVYEIKNLSFYEYLSVFSNDNVYEGFWRVGSLFFDSAHRISVIVTAASLYYFFHNRYSLIKMMGAGLILFLGNTLFITVSSTALYAAFSIANPQLVTNDSYPPFAVVSTIPEINGMCAFRDKIGTNYLYLDSIKKKVVYSTRNITNGETFICDPVKIDETVRSDAQFFQKEDNDVNQAIRKDFEVDKDFWTDKLIKTSHGNYSVHITKVVPIE